MNSSIKLFLVLAVLLSKLFSVDFFVRNDGGNDTWTGADWANAFATIQRAVNACTDNTANRIFVRATVTDYVPADINKNGLSQAARLELRGVAYGGNTHPKINGTTYCLTAAGRRYILVSGFELYSSTASCFQVDRSEWINIENSLFYENETGVRMTYSSNISIISNEGWNSGHVFLRSDSGYRNIMEYNYGHNNTHNAIRLDSVGGVFGEIETVIRYNICSYSGEANIRVGDDANGLGVLNNQIIGNAVFNNSGNWGGVHLDESDSTLVQGNYIYNCTYGIFNDKDGTALIISNVVSNNNTTYNGIYIYQCPGSRAYSNWAGYSKNGIFYDSCTGTHYAGYNILRNNDWAGLSAENGSITAYVHNNIAAFNNKQGISLNNNNGYVSNNICYNNLWEGLKFTGGNGLILNNTVVGSSKQGIYAVNGSKSIRNNICYNNTQEGLVWNGMTQDYNNLYNNNGAGNELNPATPINNTISADPLFVSTTWGSPDFLRLSSTGEGDAVCSPSVDAGDPGDPYSAEPLPNGGRINQGAYGGTVLAVMECGSPDLTSPAVTINQSASQPDPTGSLPISFDIVFSENVTGLAWTDISFSGTASGFSGSISGSGSNYVLSVNTVSVPGTVVPQVTVGAADDLAGNPSLASTSTDNSVTFTTNAPNVTINQAGGQADPTGTAPVLFDIVFAEPVYGLTFSDISFSGTATVGGGMVSGGPVNWTLQVTSVLSSGTVVPEVPAGSATNALGIGNNPSSSTDNSVTFDLSPPGVTISVAGGQADPTRSLPVLFDVIFSEDVTGLDFSDFSFVGDAVISGGTVTGSGSNYALSITAVSEDGIIMPFLPSGRAVDAFGNGNSSSVLGASVIYDITPPEIGLIAEPEGAIYGTNRFQVYQADDHTGISLSMMVISNTSDFLINFNPTTGTFTYPLNTWLLENGEYVLVLTAVDGMYNSNTITYNIEVNNIEWNPIVGPNPVNPGAEENSPFVRIQNLERDSVVNIYSVGGQLVRNIDAETLNEAFSSGEPGTVDWDLDNEKGEPVGPGIYLVVMQNADRSRKVIVKLSVVRD